MASPSPFLFDTNSYPPIDTSFTQYDPMPGEDSLQFPSSYGINQHFSTQGHYATGPTTHHHLQHMPMGHSPMPAMSGSMAPLNMPSAGAYSLQAINMQSSGVGGGFQQQLFGDHTPPPLSATSSSSSDSLQTTVSMSDIMPPPLTSGSDSSITPMSPTPSFDDGMSRSPSPSPRIPSRAHLKREATMVSLHLSQQNSPSKKRKSSMNSHQRGKSSNSHLPPVITKPADPSGARITCATFVWPDVSGLSKKDARLVKNRAAAFLSRQRKREEFEAMEKRVVKMENERKEIEASVSQREAELASIQDMKDRLSKAEARVLVAENELASKEKVYLAEIARLRGEMGVAPVNIQQADLARLAVLFSLSALSNGSSSSQIAVSANLPASVVGEVDLSLGENRPINVDLQADEDMDAEGEPEAGTPSANMRLTLQRPTQMIATRRSRAALAASTKEARFSGQLELTASPADGAQRWGFKLSFGQEA
ncbi:hypothetical protein DACRYDRAFT_25537 [Dacryopinax primogenitus]|uniref:BZIP domain-containing protein n=1 Tax=Dacryopinax primogenitus (strain DJM 731) TaxID=1858805 RepID=M5FP15_DACPD|nr:uncharacterized protein DACRYDRAFT_25537 [Dacryopinax primogenitus]EJT96713.1 hypothetical protein DACRYDRAFT_25537 [Dacryopinax primogenitus]